MEYAFVFLTALIIAAGATRVRRQEFPPEMVDMIDPNFGEPVDTYVMNPGPGQNNQGGILTDTKASESVMKTEEALNEALAKWNKMAAGQDPYDNENQHENPRSGNNYVPHYNPALNANDGALSGAGSTFQSMFIVFLVCGVTRRFIL